MPRSVEGPAGGDIVSPRGPPSLAGIPGDVAEPRPVLAGEGRWSIESGFDHGTLDCLAERIHAFGPVGNVEPV
jgi:hypothetical protein